MEIHFAPLQGFTDNHYRHLHAEIYGGIDSYYTPFLRIEKGEPRKQDMTRLKAAIDGNYRLIPQIIFNSTEEFMRLSSAIKNLGIHEIDLNLGCPYPMQTNKGRGSAMIGNIGIMSEIARIINADTDTRYSVKMRLGHNSPHEWQKLMPLLNSTRLSHITIHPRIARQMYTGKIDHDTFAEIRSASANPIIWNGDVLNPEDINAIIRQHPGLQGIMIGRGLLARPSLAAEWRSGTEWDDKKQLSTLLSFHDRLLEAYRQTLCGQTQILQKIKPFWEYLEPQIGHKTHKAIKKATTLEKYRSALPHQ